MGILKEKLLAAAELRTEVVDVEGSSVTVMEIGTAEFTQYGRISNGDEKAGVPGNTLKATAYLISSCVIDGEGKQVFTPEEAEPLARSARMSMKIVNAVMRLSGFAEKEADAS